MTSIRGSVAVHSASRFSARAPVYFFALIIFGVVAGNAFLYFHGPLNGNTRVDFGFAMPASSTAPARTQTESVAAVSPAHPALSGGNIEESAWQQERAEQLLYQRRIEEMLPLTPGVSMDQYVQADFSEAVATPEEEEVMEEDIDAGGVPTE